MQLNTLAIEILTSQLSGSVQALQCIEITSGVWLWHTAVFVLEVLFLLPLASLLSSDTVIWTAETFKNTNCRQQAKRAAEAFKDRFEAPETPIRAACRRSKSASLRRVLPD